ncbi:MAG: hypothetical protein GTO63_10050 [Anaerolineae bacterium]|nr:hypothetical protein [Anaerolineae bacterium]NIN95242.1 hypothetical protein [Anaerolineae bacterium]NIQ78211.1 hypothetical protein [Anaerolineae bacterium]
MRCHVAASAVLCFLGCLGMACQFLVTTPTSTLPPTATLPPSRTWTPTSEPIPTITPTPFRTQAPTPTLGILTDSEAIALLGEEALARGVDLQSLKISITEEPRSVSIRYTSSYNVEGSAFRAQTMLIALAAARVLIRVQPPVDGDIRLAVVPSGESEVGIRVTVIDGSALKAWADGSISDQEFVAQWMVWTVTRE